jgi:hypothetical protein
VGLAGDWARAALDGITVVTNASAHSWRGTGSARIHLSYHWLRPDGAVAILDGLRTDLPGPVEAGATARVTQRVQAPAEPGSYLLELDLVYEHVAWFADRSGGRTARFAIDVAGDPDAAQ